MTAPPKADPETLALRATPRRVVRFRRGLLIGLTALGAGAVMTVTLLALQGPDLRRGSEGEDLYTPGRAPTPEGLEGLPDDYGDLDPPAPPPILGPPLPGDLGRPILERRRRVGLEPDPADRAAEAERQRLAAQALQARESGVLFRIDTRPGGAVAVAQEPDGSDRAGADAPSLAPPGDRLALDPERDPNGQQTKLDFLNRRQTGGIYNPHALETPASPHQVMAGSIIAASLITGLNSDLPGTVIAQVTEHVYDTVTGQVLLIPQGSRLIGTYDSVIAFGQSRALVVWHRIVMPDGSSIEIDNLPATDPAGYAGLEDGVDYHVDRLATGVVLATLLGVGSELTLGDSESELVRALRESLQGNVNRAGSRLTERFLDMQPTLTIRPGFPLRVIVARDLILRPYQGG
ncbi:TrbI/VirB10 family protein [Roseospira visakhapatnamensis]|uniref:Type IV secretion system protein VirB10 n=1 Tax=Roseospira visakhapatnamensis TaxID=390880 RepID=A0A7W6RG15_9PROT|nr:TrbI/VirB10 family protein [Roseospira visakhapatnamensis]MBB4267863.1 type IV secretion system protein VirB10 [Roseospira visakhapatnamensis]